MAPADSLHYRAFRLDNGPVKRYLEYRTLGLARAAVERRLPSASEATGTSEVIKKLVKLLFWVFLAPSLLVLLLVVTGPWQFDLSGQRQRIGGLLQEHLGWQFEAEQGPVVTLSSQLGLSVGGLRLANPAWPEGPELIRAQRIELEVGLWPLLSRRLEAAVGKLAGVELWLRWDAAGRSNWQPAAGDGVPEAAPTGGPRWQLPERLDLQIENSRVDYHHLRDGTKFSLNLRAARAEGESDADEVVLALDADVDGTPLTLQGRVGRLRDLIAGSRPYPVNVQLNLLGVEGQARGVLVNPVSGADGDLKIQLHADSMAGFGPWLGERAARLEPLRVELRLHGGGQRYRAEPFRIDLGDASLQGELGLDLAGERPRVQASVQSRNLDLTSWLPRRQQEKAPSTAAATAGSGPAPRLFSDRPLAWEWLQALDAQVNIEVDQLRAHGLEAAEMRLQAGLEQGRLDAKLSGVMQGDRDYAITVSIDGRQKTPELSLSLDGDNLRLASLAEFTAAHGLVEGELELSAKLEARGRSTREIMASLNGQLLAMVEDGRADVRGLDHLVGGAGALLGHLVTANDQLAKVNCSLNGLFFEQGQGKLKMLLDTQYSVVVGSGNLDLVEERLNLRVEPKSKGVTLSVASPVLVTGPLSEPKYELEKAGILLKLTDLVAKAALPHLILAQAFGDAVGGSACATMFSDQVAEQPAAAPVGEAAGGVDAVVRGAGDAVRGALGGADKSAPDAAPGGAAEPEHQSGGSLWSH